MASPNVTEVKALEAQVNERKKLVKEIVEFVYKAVAERGTVTKREVGDWNTHVVRQLRFGDFRFVTDTGQTSQGGNEVVIHLRHREVFSFYHQCMLPDFDDPSDYRVDVFNSNDEWVRLVQELVRNWTGVVQTLEENNKQEELRRVEREALQTRKDTLREDARRLKL